MNNSSGVGYTPKDLTIGNDSQRKLLKGIRLISGAVKSTLGPMGQTVIIESPHHLHGITVTKDGVTVAKAVDVSDPVGNLAVRMMKEASSRTAVSAGDGTTTAIVLTEALIGSGLSHITDDLNRTDVLRLLSDQTKWIVSQISKRSLSITPKRLLDVATISSNNDKVIGKIIADCYEDVGMNGIVTVERSPVPKTYFETTKGIKIDRGYSSPMFINHQKKDECIMDDTKILVCDSEISSVLQIEGILKDVIRDKSRLLIIAPCTTNLIATLASNVIKNGLKVCTINPPNFGYRQHELMQDIALSVGANYFSEKTGDDLSLITSSDLGFASRVIIGRDTSVILNENLNNTDIDKRVSELHDAHSLCVDKSDKDFILQRIASLTGGVGVIYVGGNTDLEQKELFDRVDDSVCAVRSALEEGILPGAGMALLRLAGSNYLRKNIEKENKKEYRAAQKILLEALQSPFKQIIANAGLDPEEISSQLLSGGVGAGTFTKGYDLKKRQYGNLIKLGVIDPAKVTRCALENAVSVAITMLSTNVIITMARSYETE